MDLGVFFRFVFIVLLCICAMWWMSNLYHRLMQRNTGKTGLLLTGLIGVPVHEMSHAIMAVLFGHKIHKIVFFRYKESEPTLGWVEHSYNRFNFRQSVGLLYVAIAPIIFMPLLITVLLNNRDVLVGQSISTALYDWVLTSRNAQLPDFMLAILTDAENIISSINTNNLGLFCLVGCLALHAAPSKADIKTVTQSFASLCGLGSLFCVLLALIYFQNAEIIYLCINYLIQSVIFASLMAEASILFDLSAKWVLKILLLMWQIIVAKCKNKDEI